jgi:hypothetical protein
MAKKIAARKEKSPIPNDLRWFVWRQLICRDVIGEVLQFALFAENNLNGFLIDYFVPAERRKVFEELVVDRLTFSIKIEIFSRIPLAKPYKSHQNLVSILNSIRRVRNYVSHTYSLDEPALQKLIKDKNIVGWVSDFPEGLEKTRKQVTNQFYALGRAKKLLTSTWVDDEVPF